MARQDEAKTLYFVQCLFRAREEVDGHLGGKEGGRGGGREGGRQRSARKSGRKERGGKGGREGGRKGTYQALASWEDDVLVVSLEGELGDLGGSKPVYMCGERRSE